VEVILESSRSWLDNMRIEFNISQNGYAVRAAESADARAVRMLLPGMNGATTSFVAEDGQHKLVIGAAAATSTFRRAPLAGPGVAVHVIEPCRRYGIGSRLVAELATAAQAAGAAALYGAQRAELDGEAMRGWQSLGFTTCETVAHHLLPLSQFEPQLAPMVERLRERARIPANAEIIPLYKADLPRVLQLHLDNMGGDRGELYRKLRGQGTGAFHPRYSRVLVVGGQIMGCILAHRRDKDTATVDANIIDPRIRGTWANVWLKLEATRGALRLGIRNFDFTTFDHYTDTRSFTKKLGGVATQVSVLMYRPLERIKTP
jgi:predicted N-acetyltransferase YhbS